MLNKLSDYISSFSRQSKRTVKSVLAESKVEKAEIGSLINKVNSFASASDFIPSVVSSMSSIQREPLIDLFRDMDLRVKTNFDIAKSLGLLRSSMSSIFAGEIDKLQKEVLYLESYIKNWNFIAGEDDLFNENFIENFDNDSNSANYDLVKFAPPDRSGMPFAPREMAMVDPTSGTLKFNALLEESLTAINAEDVKEVNYYTNFSPEYISSNTNIMNLLSNSSANAWNMTVKSPFVIKDSIFDREEFSYARNGINLAASAQVAVEIIFNSYIRASRLRVTPNVSAGLFLVQAILETDSTNHLSENTGKNKIPLMTSPIFIDKSTDIDFNDTDYIKSITLIFAQKDYVRTKITPIQSELNSKLTNQIAAAIRLDRKKRHDTLQDLVIKYFIKDYNKDYILRNKNLYNYDYTNYYPTDLSKKSVGVLKELKTKKYYSDIDSFNKFKNTSILSNIVFSIVSYSIGSQLRSSVVNTYIESNLKDTLKPLKAYSSGGLVPLGDSNKITNNIHFLEETFSPVNQKDVSTIFANIEQQNQYEYMFSIKNINLFISKYNDEITDSFVPQRSVYMSKRLSLNGMPLKTKMYTDYFPELLRSNYDPAFDKTSIEFSVTVKDNPLKEEDWIPIMPFGDSIVRTEILFPNSMGESELRFVPNEESVILYEDKKRLDRTAFQVTGKYLKISNYNKLKTYFVSYEPTNTDVAKEVKLLSRSLANPVLVTASSSGFNGEKFEKTDFNNSVELSQNPYVDQSKFVNATYSIINGTVTTSKSTFGNFDYSSYSPVKIILEDGTPALNITNYLLSDAQVQAFYDTGLLLFMHAGKKIIFNREVNQPFRVLYQYVADIFRYRVVLRNLDNTYENYSVDRLIFKFSTQKEDTIINNFTKYNNRYINKII